MDMREETEEKQKNNAEDGKEEDSRGKTDSSEETLEKPNPDFFPFYCYSEPIQGKVILVVNKNFQHVPTERKGAENDLEYLKYVFTQKLGFEQLNKNQDFDLNKSKLENVLAEAASMDYTDTDLFVFAISTHGEERPKHTHQYEHALMCSDEQYVYTTDIIDRFSRNPTLAGKPKIFFIQACRIPYDTDEKDSPESEIFDQGHVFQILAKKVDECSLTKNNDKADAEQDKADAGHRKENDQRSQPGLDGEGQSTLRFVSNIRCPKDCLVVYAIQSGKLAWRSETDGSWMFYELHHVIKEYKQNSLMYFFDVLTKTAFGMAQRETNTGKPESQGKKAVPIIQHRLTKHLIIPLRNR